MSLKLLDIDVVINRDILLTRMSKSEHVRNYIVLYGNERSIRC